jgi:hypothetical protein
MAVRGQPEGRRDLTRPYPDQSLGMVVHACYPSCVGGVNRGIEVQADFGKNTGIYLKSN